MTKEFDFKVPSTVFQNGIILDPTFLFSSGRFQTTDWIYRQSSGQFLIPDFVHGVYQFLKALNKKFEISEEYVADLPWYALEELRMSYWKQVRRDLRKDAKIRKQFFLLFEWFKVDPIWLGLQGDLEITSPIGRLDTLWEDSKAFKEMLRILSDKIDLFRVFSWEDEYAVLDTSLSLRDIINKLFKVREKLKGALISFTEFVPTVMGEIKAHIVRFSVKFNNKLRSPRAWIIYGCEKFLPSILSFVPGASFLTDMMCAGIIHLIDLGVIKSRVSSVASELWDRDVVYRPSWKRNLREEDNIMKLIHFILDNTDNPILKGHIYDAFIQNQRDGIFDFSVPGNFWSFLWRKLSENELLSYHRGLVNLRYVYKTK